MTLIGVETPVVDLTLFSRRICRCMGEAHPMTAGVLLPVLV